VLNTPNLPLRSEGSIHKISIKGNMCHGPIKVLGALAEIIKQVCVWLRGSSREGPLVRATEGLLHHGEWGTPTRQA